MRLSPSRANEVYPSAAGLEIRSDRLMQRQGDSVAVSVSERTLIAAEVARSAATILAEYAAALRKLKDARAPKEVGDDIAAQLARLIGKRFVAATPWPQLAHLPRYLKAVVMRPDKLRADPGRDAQRLAELRPIEQRYLRHLAERKGVPERGSTNSAGCWRNCALASSRRNRRRRGFGLPDHPSHRARCGRCGCSAGLPASRRPYSRRSSSCRPAA
jgi:hypothetical protein